MENTHDSILKKIGKRIPISHAALARATEIDLRDLHRLARHLRQVTDGLVDGDPLGPTTEPLGLHGLQDAQNELPQGLVVFAAGCDHRRDHRPEGQGTVRIHRHNRERPQAAWDSAQNACKQVLSPGMLGQV